MTFSLVAYDPDTEEIGVAVHSKAFSVGSLVPFVKAGVGAVATQSLVNVALGPKGIELLEEGKTPQEVLDTFHDLDQGIEYRQLGIFSVNHGPLSFTGDNCIEWAGGKIGEDYACQGNILTGPDVIEVITDTFESSDGPLALRMVEALQAAHSVGGDARGKQSAALIIEQPDGGRANYGDRKFDLRVEDHEEPIKELHRLLSIRLLNLSVQKASKIFQENPRKGIEHLEAVLGGRMDRPYDEAWLSLAELYYKHGEKEEAKRCLQNCLTIQPGMAALLIVYPDFGSSFSHEFIAEVIE